MWYMLVFGTVKAVCEVLLLAQFCHFMSVAFSNKDVMGLILMTLILVYKPCSLKSFLPSSSLVCFVVVVVVVF